MLKREIPMLKMRENGVRPEKPVQTQLTEPSKVYYIFVNKKDSLLKFCKIIFQKFLKFSKFHGYF